MRGGALTRYHTPELSQAGAGWNPYCTLQTGDGFAEDLVQLAGPTVLQAGREVLSKIDGGMNVSDALRTSGRTLTNTLKRKAPGMGARLAGRATKRKAASTYKGIVKRFKDIFD